MVPVRWPQVSSWTVERGKASEREAEDTAHESVKSSISKSQLSGNPEVVGGVVTRTEAIDS